MFSSALSPLRAAPPLPPLEPVPRAYRQGFDSISPRQLRAWLEFLASPELEGRESGTRGFDVAARYVASVLDENGLKPRGDGGTFFQGFDLLRRYWDTETATITVSARQGAVAASAPETIPLKGEVALAVGQDATEIHWQAPWVFAGHGEGAEADGLDDFSGLRIEDCVVLVLPRSGNTAAESRGAILRGAKRIVVISDDRVKSGTGLSSPEQPEYYFSKPPAAGHEPPPEAQIIYISRAVADKILARRGLSVEKLLQGGVRPRPFALDGLEVSVSMKRAESRRATRNVVAALEGADPALKEEFIAIGAHLDHLGVKDGKVFAGADDDASGCAALLGVARAFASNPQPPRRSILFMLFAAEEKGLHGSRYLVDHPLVPLDRVVVAMQLDMVGRNEEVRSDDPAKKEPAENNIHTLHVVGSKRHSLELDPWAQRINGLVGLDFEYDEDRVYTRSDHIQFAQRGVPVVFFFSGFHPDYHQPSDTPEKINYEKLAQVARLVFGLSYEIAERDRRLVINRL